MMTERNEREIAGEQMVRDAIESMQCHKTKWVGCFEIANIRIGINSDDENCDIYVFHGVPGRSLTKYEIRSLPFYAGQVTAEIVKTVIATELTGQK